MSEDYITRNEHSKAIDRLHTRIDPINDSSIRMEESSKRMETMVNNMHTLMYGDSNLSNGIIQKIVRITTQVRMHWAIIMAILIGVMGITLKVYIR